jgi:hypothetical protein
MGLDVYVVQLLCCAKSMGADFSKTLTLGRQAVAERDVRAFVPALSAIGVPKDDIPPFQKGDYGDLLFNLLGAKEVLSLDSSDYEGATYICDLNEPCPATLLNKFSTVFDGGALEHVFNLPQALKNCMQMVSVGGHFVQVTTANNYMGHGFWQLSPEAIYRTFSKENGFLIKAVFLREVDKSGSWYQVSDPVTCGRVELANRLPTYICTIAQRYSDERIFPVWPQQSDYVEAWRRAQHAPVGIEARLRPASSIQNTRSLLGRRTPQFIKEAYRSGTDRFRVITRKRSSPFDRTYFRYIAVQDLIRGRLDTNNTTPTIVPG